MHLHPGLPGETRETIEQTIEWACKINPHTIQVSLAAPYPGTFSTTRRWKTAGWTPRTPNWWTTTASRSPRCTTAPQPRRDLPVGGGVLQALLLPAAEDRRDRREMVRDFDMMKRRLREGVEFFDFLRERKQAVAA